MLTVNGVTVSFGRNRALDGVDLEVATGEVVAILGPSGCGKSTLLRAIAGLQPLDSGEVRWDGEDLAGLPVHRRDFGLMFQEHALFSHRDVAANVAFGLRMQRMDAVGRNRAGTRSARPGGVGWLPGADDRHAVGRRGPAGRPGPPRWRPSPAC